MFAVLLTTVSMGSNLYFVKSIALIFSARDLLIHRSTVSRVYHCPVESFCSIRTKGVGPEKSSRARLNRTVEALLTTGGIVLQGCILQMGECDFYKSVS